MLRGMAWLVSDARVLASAEIASSGASRRRGLLSRDGVEGALVIERCRWVHTMGMRFPIDVAFLDADGIVVKIVTMRRHRLGMPVRRAHCAIEAEAGAFDRWGLKLGDEIEIRLDQADEPVRHDPAGRPDGDDDGSTSGTTAPDGQ